MSSLIDSALSAALAGTIFSPRVGAAETVTYERPGAMFRDVNAVLIAETDINDAMSEHVFGGGMVCEICEHEILDAFVAPEAGDTITRILLSGDSETWTISSRPGSIVRTDGHIWRLAIERSVRLAP